jgi:hypothetical protein
LEKAVLNIHRIKSFVAVVGLVLGAVIATPAHAAFLRFSISALTPAAQPQIEVSVSGVTVFNAVTSGFSTPINTTGRVVIRIRALPDYQVFEGWTGVCAGILPGQPCEFDAGLSATYDAGAIIRNRVGTLRFTSSSVDVVRPPTVLPLTLTSSPDGASGDLTVRTDQPGSSSLTLVVGNYGFAPRPAQNFDCVQAPTQPSLSPLVQEGLETIVNVEYRGDRCLVVVDADVFTNGSVTSDPAGIDCPFGTVIAPGSSSVCAALFPFKSIARLEPTPKAGFVSMGWSSGCRPALQRTCEAVAQPSVAAKRPVFAPASTGSADLGIEASGLIAEDVGGGKVRISLTLRNLGTSTASGVQAEIGATQAGAFTDMPSVVSDGGDCDAFPFCRWNSLGDLASGQSKTVSFTAASIRTTFPLVGCTLGTTPDPNRANDCVSVVATLGVSPPAGPASVAIGLAPPPNVVAAKGAVDVPALQFTVRPPASVTFGHQLVGVTLAITGTGQDALDIVAVRLYPDDNGNGVVDSEEKRLFIASGRFDADNGVARLTLAPDDVLSGRTYLVALDVNTSIASGVATQAGLTGLSACMALWGFGVTRRRRVAVATCALALGVLAVGCGGGGGGSTPVTRTYRVSVTEVQVVANGQAVTVTGAPISGAEISVVK